MGKIVELETAKLAKERGFIGETKSYYVLDFQNFKSTGVPVKFNMYRSIGASQPHIASAMKVGDLQDWLREQHDIHVEVSSHKYVIPELANLPRSFKFRVDKYHSPSFSSYDKALEEGLLHVLKAKERWTKK